MPLSFDVPHHHYNWLLIRIALPKWVVIIDYIIVTAWFVLPRAIVALNLVYNPQQMVLLVNFVRATQVLKPRLRHTAKRCHKTATTFVGTGFRFALLFIGEAERA